MPLTRLFGPARPRSAERTIMPRCDAVMDVPGASAEVG